MRGHNPDDARQSSTEPARLLRVTYSALLAASTPSFGVPFLLLAAATKAATCRQELRGASSVLRTARKSSGFRYGLAMSSNPFLMTKSCESRSGRGTMYNQVVFPRLQTVLRDT